jgi:subtilisin family serine protease
MANGSKANPRVRAWRQAALLLVLAALAVYQGASSFAAARSPRSKIEAGLLESLAARGEASFWVLMREEADLSPAYGMVDPERGEFVYRELRRVADGSQAGLREALDARGTGYQSYWIANTLQVTGDASLLLDIAARSDVRSIQAEASQALVQARPGRDEGHVNGPEWGLDRIGALKVWDLLGTKGAGVVVANLDTGVQFDHPALVDKYRGNLGGGTFNHNYNWFDPSNTCGSPSLAPCDNVGTGTHTMGTIVGSDGPNQIGVAPEAQWIAVKSCETNSCSQASILAAGQWILAPQDLAGGIARPSMRPHVVTVSWGVRGGRNFFQSIINSWHASGIFPAVANGDFGPECGTASSPADYRKSYSAGAFDINNVVATFSSRGPSPGNFPKPNVGAPGVNVRSAYSNPPNSYVSLSGSAMGAAHVAGTVALIWSYNPLIVRQVGTARHLIDNTARNMPPDACGGVPDMNNAWGDGRLNAYNAVRTSPIP